MPSIPYPVMKQGLYTVLDQVSASMASLNDAAGRRTTMHIDPDEEAAVSPRPVGLSVTRGSYKEDPERAQRIEQEQENARQRSLLGRLDYQSELLKQIHQSLESMRHSKGSLGNSIGGSVTQAAVERVGSKVLESVGSKGLIPGLLEAAGAGLTRVGNVGQVAGALRGGVAGRLLEGGGRALAAGGEGLAVASGSKLASMLSGPLGYALISGGIGAWNAAHESTAEMKGKYGRDNAGFRVLEAGRQGLSNATFGLSEYAFNEVGMHAPKTSHAVVNAIAGSLERRIDSVRGLWNPQARAALRQEYGTKSSMEAMTHAMVGTLTGGLSDWFDKPDSAFGKQINRIADSVDNFKSSIFDDGGLIDRVSDSFSTAFQNVDWQHVGLGEVLERAADGVAKTVTGDKSTTAARELAPLAERGRRAAGKVREEVDSAAAKTAQVVSDVRDWVLGNTSKHYESGKGGAGTVSTGKGDAGGASYGTYQMSSKRGVVQDFLRSSEYGKQFAGLQPGTQAFNDRWKEVAKSDPKFAQAQHDFIKRTHFDVQRADLAKHGIDLSKRGAAVQDAIWSTSVQFGGKTGVIRSALAGQDASKMSDADIVHAIQQYKESHNDSLFKSSSAETRANVLKREHNEETSLLALDAAEQKARATTVPTPATTVASARAVPNPDVQQAARASVAPVTPAAPAAPTPVQVAQAPVSIAPGRVPSDFSSIGLMLFNLSVFS